MTTECTFPGCRSPKEYPGHRHPTGRGDELIFSEHAQEVVRLRAALSDIINISGDLIQAKTMAARALHDTRRDERITCTCGKTYWGRDTCPTCGARGR